MGPRDKFEFDAYMQISILNIDKFMKWRRLATLTWLRLPLRFHSNDISLKFERAFLTNQTHPRSASNDTVRFFDFVH